MLLTSRARSARVHQNDLVHRALLRCNHAQAQHMLAAHIRLHLRKAKEGASVEGNLLGCVRVGEDTNLGVGPDVIHADGTEQVDVRKRDRDVRSSTRWGARRHLVWLGVSRVPAQAYKGPTCARA
jgi:hypothetical protein